MREIKFRALDMRTRKWVPRTEILSKQPMGNRGELYEKAPWFVLMQYIGLKDKSGVEIYEGDIVRVWHYNHAMGALETPDIYEVIFGKNAAFILHNNSVWPWVGFDEAGFSKYEVIGNIHETPELLEAHNA